MSMNDKDTRASIPASTHKYKLVRDHARVTFYRLLATDELERQTTGVTAIRYVP